MKPAHRLVSVIVPMRNAEAYVSDTLTSILREQETPLEVIVVNDKSSDASLARVLAVRDERVRLLDGPGRGISASLNVGLAAARGAVVMRCDADDLYPEGRISQQSRWLAEHSEYDAVCGAFSTIDPSGRLIAHLDTGGDPLEITKELASGTVRTHLCTYAIRSSLVQKLEGFREYFGSGEDIDYQLRLGEAGRIRYEPQNWYFYRLHPSSVTHTQRTHLREFFSRTAYDLQNQRRECGIDALQRGSPPPLPNGVDSSVHGAKEHIQGMLLGHAWREHRMGRRMRALRAGARALAVNPRQLRAWKSFAALILKSSNGRWHAGP